MPTIHDLTRRLDRLDRDRPRMLPNVDMTPIETAAYLNLFVHRQTTRPGDVDEKAEACQHEVLAPLLATIPPDERHPLPPIFVAASPAQIAEWERIGRTNLWRLDRPAGASRMGDDWRPEKGLMSMGNDDARREAENALGRAGWSIYSDGYSTGGVTLTFRRDLTPEHREIVERQTFGKTKTEAIRVFLDELANEQSAGDAER